VVAGAAHLGPRWSVIHGSKTGQFARDTAAGTVKHNIGVNRAWALRQWRRAVSVSPCEKIDEPDLLRFQLPEFLQKQRLGDDHPLQLTQVEAFVGGVDLGSIIAGAPDDELGIRS
jgi:hypothetical protein